MVVILFPVFLTWCFGLYHVKCLFFTDPYISSLQSYNFSLYPIQTCFIRINKIPISISCAIKCFFTLLKKLNKKYKNSFFFIIVLQVLLFVSGDVEINPGPLTTKKTNISFAIWNVDSIPARDYARIPLI